ncbi:intradiol ring-cleavage dioxygenase [Muriicola soli]|uniref:Intradiol ring-cleavage dioxygenase n=1 Tax=Muriicola soli TaxID=2507538 RepID=A0A411E912_9FLAO|nr:intradiol ring-cleavage dioxygenase [Muriicola soli]QBA64033.1 intradiol ring-cleavage dioxygenase [Muriicola soli]
MKNSLLSVLMVFLFIFSCRPQNKEEKISLVGGPCEGCEAIYEYGNRQLTPTDTLPDFFKTEPKLKISGIVYKSDGKTPASDVILYVYQTNREGIYPKKGNEKGWARRDGYIRGWVKTGKNGQYTFYTFRPASYPNRSEPEHIHITLKEQGINEYYIDAFVFDDDTLLTAERRTALTNRGGSGIVRPVLQNGIYTADRDIILGLNIPDYEE